MLNFLRSAARFVDVAEQPLDMSLCFLFELERLTTRSPWIARTLVLPFDSFSRARKYLCRRQVQGQSALFPIMLQ